jgi:hypothetical protein
MEAELQGRASPVEVLEPGHVYFFYRPKVEKEAGRSRDDVQRMYLLLHPRGKRVYRLLIVGEKRLPAVRRDADRKSWAFVQKVGRRPEDVEDELDPETYTTKTRGERHVPAARTCGEGVYVIVRHGEHTHFAYVLELPRHPGKVQLALNIGEEGSYVVSVKNPDVPSPPGVGLGRTRRAEYPEKLRERFGNRRFINLDPPDFLDYEGTEILLIGASQDVRAELGLDLDPEHETAAAAAVFDDLKLEKSLHPVTPLLQGKWA